MTGKMSMAYIQSSIMLVPCTFLAFRAVEIETQTDKKYLALLEYTF